MQDAGMAEIVNLHREKQRRAREEESAAARQNRARHGRTKAERANDTRDEARRQALLDALRRSEPRE
jgi:hypothetical protein